jgi:hypothetical protein
MLESDSAALKTVAVCQETLSRAGRDQLYSVNLLLNLLMGLLNDKKQGYY